MLNALELASLAGIYAHWLDNLKRQKTLLSLSTCQQSEKTPDKL